MNIALLGYGKMGKAIEKIALERGHKIVLKITSSSLFSPKVLRENKADVAIEFSTPNNAVYNILTCFEADVPVIVGTTGWYDDFEMVEKRCKEEEQALLYATNFSIGVNIFFEINKTLARLMNTQEQYKVAIEEIHHTEKLDAPSGTAITLAEQIIENIKKKEGWKLEPNEYSNDTVSITAKRIDKTPGTHVVTYDSDIDTIEIKHTAKSRKGFALGAVLAAEFVYNKKGVFTMQDVLGIANSTKPFITI